MPCSLHGLSVIVGASAAAVDIVGEDMRVKSKDAAVFAANLMAADQGVSKLGDADPDFKLQPGDKVSTVGPEVKNAHGVSFTPVTVQDHDGPFFIRSSSLSIVVSESPKAPVAAKVPWKMPSWGWALIALGSAAGVAALLGVSLRGRHHAGARR